jgi:hypothetical protein
VLLAGSHHWDVLCDGVARPEPFDFDGYLDQLAEWSHNFVRLWTHEAWLHDLSPRPFPRTGPGLALDGLPRFDLARFDPEYFGRLRERTERASRRGFYVAVMLFNGWSIESKGYGNPWDHHPMNRRNNVNGVDGDPDARGDGADVHTLRVASVLKVQEAYVRQVFATLADFDGLLWEVANESHGDSLPWQLSWVRLLRELGHAAGRSHPIGLTACHPGNRNDLLFRSEADWIAPGNPGGYSGRSRDDPPPSSGRKVVLLDTDHLWGVGGDAAWIWKAFLRGHHPVYMDPLDADPVRQGARQAMGQILELAAEVDLARMQPSCDFASSGYALVDPAPGRETIVALFPGGKGRIDLRGIGGELHLEWREPRSGEGQEGGTIQGGGKRRLAAPWPRDAVAVLQARPSGRS